MPLVIFLSDVEAKLSARLQHCVLWQRALFLTGPSGENQKVVLRWFHALTNFCKRFWEIPLQALKVVVGGSQQAATLRT